MAVGLRPAGKPLELPPTSIATAPRFYSTCFDKMSENHFKKIMARAWRIEYEGALYHVLSRGNERQDIVISDDDCKLFFDTVGEMGERFDTDIFCYVLMVD